MLVYSMRIAIVRGGVCIVKPYPAVGTGSVNRLDQKSNGQFRLLVFGTIDVISLYLLNIASGFF